MKKFSKRGQLTLFIILAIVLVVGVVGFFVYRGYSKTSVSNVAQPIYSAYLSCIEQLTEEGVGILGSQGGYIETPEFEPGSPFMPSSSQLDFLGVGVPYWFYVSGNNLVKEQIPTKRNMENELQQYIQDNLQSCDFSEFEERGYLVDVDKGSVTAKIAENQIQVNVKNNLRLSFDEEIYSFDEHKVVVTSKLGKFYDLALKIYDSQTEEKFLSNYALDTLMLNAPTSGFEEGCTPIIFNFNEIRSNVSQALSTNIASVKTKGSYYSNEDKYFVKDVGVSVSDNVNFIYSSQWPTKIEIYGKEFAEPVGLQPGMNVLGFCFVEYQLIYDVAFPVLVQISDEKEIFQFPIVIIIEKNQVRKDIASGEFLGKEEVICKNRNQDMDITAVDLGGNSVKATISFSCLGERCYLGEVGNTAGKNVLKTKVPMCVNGFVDARAEGYAPGSFIVSSNSESSAEVLLKKIHTLQLDLGNVQGKALVQFNSEEFSKSVFYPENRNIELVEGVYDISVQVFKNSSIVFPAKSEQKCFEMPTTGIGALTGATENKCYNIEIPAQTIEQVLIGGGKAYEFFDDSSLSIGNKIFIDVPSFSAPSKIEEINENYIKLEDSFLNVRLS